MLLLCFAFCLLGTSWAQTDVFMRCPGGGAAIDLGKDVTFTCSLLKSSYPSKCVSAYTNTTAFRYSSDGKTYTPVCELTDILGDCPPNSIGCSCGTHNLTHYNFEYTFTTTTDSDGYYDCFINCRNFQSFLLFDDDNCKNKQFIEAQTSTTDDTWKDPFIGVVSALGVVAVAAGVFFGILSCSIVLKTKGVSIPQSHQKEIVAYAMSEDHENKFSDVTVTLSTVKKQDNHDNSLREETSMFVTGKNYWKVREAAKTIKKKLADLEGETNAGGPGHGVDANNRKQSGGGSKKPAVNGSREAADLTTLRETSSSPEDGTAPSQHTNRVAPRASPHEPVSTGLASPSQSSPARLLPVGPRMPSVERNSSNLTKSPRPLPQPDDKLGPIPAGKKE